MKNNENKKELYLLNGTTDGNISTIDSNYYKGLSPSDVKNKRGKRTHIVENKIRKLGNVNPSGAGQVGRVYDPEGVSPTVDTFGELKIVDNKIKKVGNFNGHQSGQVYDSEGISPTLCSKGDGGKTGWYKIITEGNINPSGRGMGGIVYNPNGISPTITINKGSGIRIKTNTEKGYDSADIGDGVRLDHPGGETGRGRVQKNKTGTLSCNTDWGTVTPNYRIRRLTPVECERLQAFPDDWTRYGKDGEKISDTQRYKCIGNAVTTTVVTAIINEMFDDEDED